VLEEVGRMVANPRVTCGSSNAHRRPFALRPLGPRSPSPSSNGCRRKRRSGSCVARKRRVTLVNGFRGQAPRCTCTTGRTWLRKGCHGLPARELLREGKVGLRSNEARDSFAMESGVKAHPAQKAGIGAFVGVSVCRYVIAEVVGRQSGSENSASFPSREQREEEARAEGRGPQPGVTSEGSQSAH